MTFPPFPPAFCFPDRRCGGHLARTVATVVLSLAGVAARLSAAETAADFTTRTLLDKLNDRGMPDVALWVLDRVVADPDASAEMKAEVPFRRALALIGISRTEADGKKRAAHIEEARKQIDQFLAANPTGLRAIDAYTQKGNLLIEQGLTRIEQAKRPGADVVKLRAEAVGFFDQALKTLEGRVKPGEPITSVDNAEDAVVKEFREIKEQIAALKPKQPNKDDDAKGPKKDDDAKGPKKEGDPKGRQKPVRLDPVTQRKLERLEEDQKEIQGKLVQTRLVVASLYFEKSKVFDEKSTDWTATMETSTKQFKEIADKYPAFAAGLLARYYEGRNLAVLGRWEKAAGTLAELVAIEDKSDIGVMLRAKALTTSLECWLAQKKFDAFDDTMRLFALDKQNLLRRLSQADRLALKYRAAEFFKAQADTFTGKDAPRGKILLADAARLAMEVAKVNREFGDEARALVQSLGKDVLNAADRDFASIIVEAQAAVRTMQDRQAEAKKLQAEGGDAAAAIAAAGAARDEALAKFDEALARAEAPPAKGEEPAPERSVSNARYMKTFLLFDGKRYAEAADLGTTLVERSPNALGSRQAGMIAIAALQQMAKGSDPEAAQAAKGKLRALAGSIATIWPGEKEGADALGILANMAIDTRNPQVIIELVEKLPAAASGRAAIVGRAGTALWREVAEQGRAEGAVRVAPEVITGWKAKARAYLDESLQAPPGTGTALRAAANAALARAQIALDEGDAAAAVAVLEAPGHGPWTIVNDPQADAALREGPFAESTLTMALRAFIQAERLGDAQKVMDRLEALAGAGDSEEKSSRLSAMYSMTARQLQEQLERLSGAADAAARQKAVAILGGFEKFLDGLAKRDTRVASQLWVAMTFQELGSGEGTGAVVPKAKAERYLDRAAEVYATLLAKKNDADVGRFEPSIRRKMSAIYQERGRWDDAQQQMDWILADAKRQNSPETQVQAAEMLQAAGQSLAATDAAAAEAKFIEAIVGRPRAAPVAWGWAGIAKKLAGPAFSGNDEKALKAREVFFNARLNQANCHLQRAQLPGKQPDKVKEALVKAEDAIATTRKYYPDLGGPTMKARFEDLLKRVQKARGSAEPRGFAELDEKAAAAAPATGT